MTRQEREATAALLAEVRRLRLEVELSQQGLVGAAWDIGRLEAELARRPKPLNLTFDVYRAP